MCSSDLVHEHIKNVVFLIEDYNPRSPHILGQYTGVALPKRTFDHTGFLPDTIAIYRQALKDYCWSEDELIEQVRITALMLAASSTLSVVCVTTASFSVCEGCTRSTSSSVSTR